MTVTNGITALKKRPKAGLLRVASLLPVREEDWKSGVSYVPEGCFSPDAVAICDPDTNKPRVTPQAAVTFEPFGIVANDGCNDPWALSGEFTDRAGRVLEMGQSAILARELLASTVTSNPDLESTAVDLTAAMTTPAAVGWQEAATALLYAMMNAGYVGDVWIHAPSWLLPSFNSSQIGYTDPATGISYIGPHPVIFDAGYSGLIGPGGLPGDAEPNVAGWVYASGPVEYNFGTSDSVESGNSRQNDRYYVAERPGILRFDPCQVFGILTEVC